MAASKSVSSQKAPASILSEAAHACRLLTRRDRILGAVIRQVGPITLKPQGGGYDMLVRSILSQQISTAAARTIRGRLEALLPGGRLKAESISLLTDEQLQQVGVSSQKRGYLRDLTQRTLDGSLNFRRIAKEDDDAVIAELIQVRGIGRWTAQMYLMFCLGRPDVFAPDDLGLQNAVVRLYELPARPAKLQLEEISSRWAPWRTIASWYLWRSLELKK